MILYPGDQELGTKVNRVKKIKEELKGPGNELDMADWGDGGSRFLTWVKCYQKFIL